MTELENRTVLLALRVYRETLAECLADESLTYDERRAYQEEYDMLEQGRFEP